MIRTDPVYAFWSYKYLLELKIKFKLKIKKYCGKSFCQGLLKFA